MYCVRTVTVNQSPYRPKACKRQLFNFPSTGVIILPTHTSYIIIREIPENYHSFVVSHSPKIGKMTPVFFWGGDLFSTSHMMRNGTPGIPQLFTLQLDERIPQNPISSAGNWCLYLSHEKKRVLSIKSWLLNRDPYNGLWNNPHIAV